MAVVLRFPEPAIDLDRVRLDSEEPCLVLILPRLRIARDEESFVPDTEHIGDVNEMFPA